MLDLSNDHNEIKTFAEEILHLIKQNVLEEIFQEKEISFFKFDIHSLKKNIYYEKYDKKEQLDDLRNFIKNDEYYPGENENTKIKSVNEINHFINENMVNTNVDYLKYIQAIENEYLLKKRKKNYEEIETMEEEKEDKDDEEYSKKGKKHILPVKEEEKKINFKEIEDLNKNLKKDETIKINEKYDKVVVDFLLNSPMKTRSKNSPIESKVNQEKTPKKEKNLLTNSNSKEFEILRKEAIKKLFKSLKKVVILLFYFR